MEGVEAQFQSTLLVGAVRVSGNRGKGEDMQRARGCINSGQNARFLSTWAPCSNLFLYSCEAIMDMLCFTKIELLS